LDDFNRLFLWRAERTVSKYAQISLEGNKYSVCGVAPKSKVQVRYNPFDLTEIQVFYKDKYIGKSKANVLTNKQVKKMPEEADKSVQQVSEASSDYFKKLREKHMEKQQEAADNFNYSQLNNQE
jgi:hypothetical protein